MARVAVIGGGISGLSCVHYLRKFGRDVVNQVTLFERQATVGGFIQTTRFPDGTVYEHGPHSLRPFGKEGFNSLSLADELGLTPDVLHVTAKHPSAKNRMILVNNNLYNLPSVGFDIFRKMAPFHKPFIFYAIKDLFTKKEVVEGDESLDSFFRRRFSDEIADFAIDPFCRGVTAGCSKEISLRSFAPTLFKSNEEHGSLLKGQFKIGKQDSALSQFLDCDLAVIAKKDLWASWTLRNGLQQFPIALEAHLKSDDGVTLCNNKPCHKIFFSEKKALLHFENDGVPRKFDHIFACVPAKHLSEIVSFYHPKLSQILSNISSVHVAVVNLEYQGKVLSREGFGYLVPSNQESKVLGVIFNSCTYPEQDGDNADRTRLTCMMGGRWFHEYFGDVNTVNPNDLFAVAVSEVSKHLRIKEDPIRHDIKIQKNCIAQYHVGHYKVLEAMQQEILEKNMCLSVTGSSYHGLAVNDCIYNARMAVESYLDSLRV